jgi:endo-1,4-beta-xylanase
MIPRPRSSRRRPSGSLVALACVAALATASCGDAPRTGAGARGCTGPIESCTLGEVATSAGVRAGAGGAVGHLVADDPDYAAAIVRHFNALTPNAELKWQATQPRRDAWDFADADRLVAFAEQHGLEVRGHTLVWAHEDFYDVLPQYVNDVTDPELLREVTREHVEGVTRHFAGRIHRYDAVNEPLTIAGDDLHDNVYRRLLGDLWVAEVFRMAREADPQAELWLNENLALSRPGKAETLYALVERMMAAGAPIDGIGFQGHFLGPAPDPAQVEATVRRFAALGLRVAITEMDYPMPPRPDGPELQGATFHDIAAACLRVPACEEITVWGIDDGHTWLDGLIGAGSRPLLLDDGYREKPAYAGLREAIAARLLR